MIAIIDYEAGNTRSVKNAVERLGSPCEVTDDLKKIKGADKVILPGVGQAKSAMQSLENKGIDQLIPQLKQPFLGICLGLQVMCEASQEGNTKCLGIFKTRVNVFPPKDRVPQMGWNSIEKLQGPLFVGIEESSDLYFVHSYYAAPCDQTAATCEYILPFSAALQKDNFFATQFHPEKSAKIGLQILKNFMSL